MCLKGWWPGCWWGQSYWGVNWWFEHCSGGCSPWLIKRCSITFVMHSGDCKQRIYLPSLIIGLLNPMYKSESSNTTASGSWWCSLWLNIQKATRIFTKQQHNRSLYPKVETNSNLMMSVRQSYPKMAAKNGHCHSFQSFSGDGKKSELHGYFNENRNLLR